MRPPQTLFLAVVVGLVAAACGSSSRPDAAAGSGTVVEIVAAENFWGDIAAQLGGNHVKVTSIISDPSADPHLYESDAGDAAAISRAQFVIENGLGYDNFVDDLLSASPNDGRETLIAADVLRITQGGANPHLWYDIPRVHEVAQAIVMQLTKEDPDDKATFDANLATFDASLKPILDVIDLIKTEHPGAPVAYTERVAGYLLDAAGLMVKSPAGFSQAIEDGSEPNARDTQAMNALMNTHGVKALLYNAQATSPVTQAVQDLARENDIPVVGVTETLPKGEANYQSWQLHQAQALLDALRG